MGEKLDMKCNDNIKKVVTCSVFQTNKEHKYQFSLHSIKINIVVNSNNIAWENRKQKKSPKYQSLKSCQGQNISLIPSRVATLLHSIQTDQNSSQLNGCVPLIFKLLRVSTNIQEK